MSAYENLRASEPPLHRMHAGTFGMAVPELARQFDREVPPEFVAQVEENVVEVACPCGESPRVRKAMFAFCGCGRCFVHLGKTVRVAFSPKGSD